MARGLTLPATLAAACSSSPGVKVNDRAKPLGDIAKQATVKSDSLLFPRDGNDDLAAVPMGTVLISDWQDGYLRTVMSVDDGNGMLTIGTQQAALTDVIDSGDSQVTVSTMSLQKLARTWPGVQPYDGTLGTSFAIPLKGKQIYADKDLGLSVRVADGQIMLAPSLDVGLSIGDDTMFHALATGTITADLQLVVDCEKSLDKTFTVTLWESPEFSVPLPPIGPIPISAQAKLIVTAGLEISAKGQVTVTMGASTTSNISYGLAYAGGAWTQQGSADATWTPMGPTISTDVEAHAKIDISAGVEVGLYGGLHLLDLGAGGAVGMSIEPYVSFDYPAPSTAAAGTPWTLTAGFQGHYYAALTVLDKQVAGIDQPGKQLFDTGQQILPTTDMTLPMQAGDCGDGTQDGAETDVDCGGASGGGSCTPCMAGQGCLDNPDCASGQCNYGVCIAAIPATCYDGVFDGDENGGVDCGGSCLACTSDNCAQDADCASGACDTTTTPGSCLPPLTCYDGVTDAGETDVDCGGPCAPTLQCMDGMACASLDDCEGWACPGETDFIAVTGTCSSVPLNCFDCVQDGDEDGVDCGGSCGIEPTLVCTGSPPVSQWYADICD